MTRLPTITIDDLEATSIDELSKFYQRLASTGFLPRTRDVVNKGLNLIGLEDLPPDVELDDVLPESTSRSGDGLVSAGAGTSTDGNNIASGDNNLDNTG